MTIAITVGQLKRALRGVEEHIPIYLYRFDATCTTDGGCSVYKASSVPYLVTNIDGVDEFMRIDFYETVDKIKLL